MSGRATDKMLEFARDIAGELNIDLPVKQNADGDWVEDDSYEGIHDFIEENKDEFYEWRRS